MALNPRHLTLIGSNGGVSFYTYSTADAAASVLAAGYFNAVQPKLKANDVILAMCARDAAGDFVQMKVTASPSGGTVTVDATDQGSATNRAVTATADGLTTGLLTSADRVVDVTAANAAHLVTLPPIADVPINHVIRLSVGANGHKLVTPAASGTKINNVNAQSGTASMTVPASSISIVTKQAADNWMVECFVAAGTRTIPTPA